jgi:hypothetical protein
MKNTPLYSSFTFLIAIVGVACTSFSQATPVHKASVDSTCSIISTEMIAKVQGAHFVDSKPATHDDGHFKTATCYYKLEPEYQSVSLEVISRSKSGARSPLELWTEKFHSGVAPNAASVPESGKTVSEPEGSAEAEHRTPPEHVKGVGDDAFWVDTGRDGALYVLNGERIIRLSLGGRTRQQEKKVRATEIAKSAVLRSMSE